MAAPGNTARKILGGISVVLSLCLLIASAWLLGNSLNDPHCKNFERRNVYSDDLHLESGGYFNQERDWSFIRDGLGPGRGHRREYVEGRNLDDYCINFIDNWTIGSGIAVGIAVLQFMFSVGQLMGGFGDAGSRSWTVVWCILNIFFVIGLGGSLFFGISGEAYRYFIQISNIGFCYCAAAGVDALAIIIMTILAYIYILKTPGQKNRRRPESRPVSRTEYIRAPDAARDPGPGRMPESMTTIY